MNQYPIYNKVEACIYKSDKSWGAKDTSNVKVLVGSSSNNSHDLITHTTTRRFKYNEELGRVVCSFRFYVDGVCIKEMLFEDNNGKAGEYISTTSIIPEKGIQ